MSYINTTNVIGSLTDEQKSALVELAITSANNLGYCDESSNVLNEMGLDGNPRRTYNLVVNLEVQINVGSDVEHAVENEVTFDFYGEGDPEAIAWSVVSVEQA